MSPRDVIGLQRLSGRRERELEAELERVYSQREALRDEVTNSYESGAEDERRRIVKFLNSNGFWMAASAIVSKAHVE